jgi:23S rRNA pseudouridine2605 synthase
MGEERLQKYIASCGVTSRRKAEELILQGRVEVNGEKKMELGAKVDPEKDSVKVDGKEIKTKKNFIYIKLYKPEGYVTTVKDQFGRKTVMDLVASDDRIYPIGRLDYDTSGLILLTNDGDLANRLMHPSYHIYKTYDAKVEGKLSQAEVEKLRSGINIEDYRTAPAKVNVLKESGRYSVVRISIFQGKNRQVRKMFDSVGHNVIELKRISFGDISLGSLTPGQWTNLTEREIKYLKSN